VCFGEVFIREGGRFLINREVSAGCESDFAKSQEVTNGINQKRYIN